MPCLADVVASQEKALVKVPSCSYMTTVVILKEIQLRDAKATLSAVVDDAVHGEPCVITRHGRREAVLIAYEEWEKLSRVPSFGRLLISAPLEEEDLPKRNRKPLRRIGL
jgi:antitoxin Phd